MSVSRRPTTGDKPPPPTGPGSRVVALSDVVKRHVIPITTSGITSGGYELRYSTLSVRALPKELFANEELMNRYTL